VVHRTVSGAPGWLGVNWALSRKEKGDVAITHWTVRWCTGLSGGAPDCPVSQLCQRPTIGRAINARHVVAPTVGWAHRTIWCANLSRGPTAVVPHMERNRAPDCYSGCPVVHRVVRCTTRQKARIAYQIDVQRLLAALGL
jgi:hypothetical protein